MANKRQRKKQQAKQNVSLLESLGIGRKQAERVKNKPLEVKRVVTTRKKEIKKETRKRVANDRSHYLKKLGYKVSEHSSKRYWSEEHWDKWVKEQEEKKALEEKKAKKREYQRKYRERKKKEAAKQGKPVLLMLWKDRTDTAMDDSTLQLVKESGKQETIPELVRSLNEARNYTSGEIGDYKIEITTSPGEVMSYYAGEYYKQYEGNGTQYKKLLIAIGAMMAGLYYPHEKELFLFELVATLSEINQKAARRLADDFQLYM